MNVSNEICPLCGGQLASKRVEKLLRGGENMAVAFATADVCQRCGERLYSPEAVRFFEKTRAQLANRETTGFVPLGKSFEVTDVPNAPAVP